MFENWKTIFQLLYLLSIATGTIAFNIQNLTDGLVLKPADQRNENLFGFSIVFHKNKYGKRLIVSAPKKFSRRNTSSTDSNETETSGSLYSCSLDEHHICSELKVSVDTEKEIVFSCNFENSTLNQVLTDDFNWTRTNEPAPSEGTGPSHDHTSQIAGANSEPGYYLLMEASEFSAETGSGKSATVTTDILPATLGDCLRFWYHMLGEKVASLNLYMQTTQIGLVSVWSKQGNQGDRWIEGHVTIISEHPYKVVFEGIKENWEGDIGIDDVTIKKGQCREDVVGIVGSFGTTLLSNPSTMDILSCNPYWKYNCSGQIHASGACYLLSENLTTNHRSIFTPIRNQACSTTQVDIVFIIDSSYSVSSSDFNHIKLWLRNVISALPVGTGLVQVGVMIYSAVPTVNFHLNKYHKIEGLRSAIKNMNFTGGKTNTGRAIEVATQEMFRVENGMRETSKHVAIVMTDGKSQDDVTGPSQAARKKGITMFSIGVGTANKTELREIATDPDKYIFTITDYSALSKIKNTIQEKIASLESQGKTTTTEQGQAGFCGIFHQDAYIIGAPGLDNWSGGYSSYYVRQGRLNEPSHRITTTFQNLCNDVIIASVDTRHKNNTTIEATANWAVSGAGVFVDHPLTNLEVRMNSSVWQPTEIGFLLERVQTNRTTSSSIFTGQSSGDDVSVNPSQEEVVADESSSYHEDHDISSVLTGTSQSLLSFAYFGYSVSSGKFLSPNQTDLAFGAPRAASAGMVFIVRQDTLSDSLHNKARLKQKYKGSQMGSYFGFCLCAADTNGDGIDELVVGAPLWSGSQQDEGRVFVYVSDINKRLGSVERKELILKGNRQGNGRFGFSLASPGDLNLDGFDDVIVGAPSNAVGEGIIYVYYGRPGAVGIAVDQHQAIKSSDSNVGLSLFGYTLESAFDADGNGYNDIAVGAPGSGDVVVLLTCPVVHVNVQFDVDSLSLDANRDDVTLWNKSNPCNRTSAEHCALLKACFLAHGKQIPEKINLTYELNVDINMNEGMRRGRVSNPSDEIQVTVNETKCIEFLIKLKHPVRHQLTPLVTSMTYQLSTDDSESSSTPALLDIFDAGPKYAKIDFVSSCRNHVCFSDLNLDCSFADDLVQLDSSSVTVGAERRITINLNLTNHLESAYDVEFEVLFPPSLYFMRVLPMQAEMEKCAERKLFSDSLAEKSNRTSVQNHQPQSQVIRFYLKNPVMKDGEYCALKVQFGFQNEFEGGKLKFSFEADSDSEESSRSDNICHLNLDVKFEANLILSGNSKPDQISFSGKNESGHGELDDDVGPIFTHSYNLINSGPSAVPSLKMDIQWPALTASQHRILHLTEITCEPIDVCECQTFAVLNGSCNVSSSEDNDENVVRFGNHQSNVDYETRNSLRSVALKCTGAEDGVTCQTVNCHLKQVLPQQVVSIQLEFRLSKRIFVRGEIWKAVVSTMADVSTDTSPFIVDSKGRSRTKKSLEIETKAFNKDITFSENNSVIEWWIIAVSVLVGFLTLFLFVFGLYKLEFFKSKYKQQLQEEFEWTQPYQQQASEQCHSGGVD